MKFAFQLESDARMPHRLASAEVVFEDLGVVLTGLTIWARKDGQPGQSVTLPAQRTKEGTNVRYHDYLRSLDEKGQGVKRLKQAILDAFWQEHPQLAVRDDRAQAPLPREAEG